MPRIPDEWIERIKHEVSVVLLAERAGVELKRVGEELVGRCPFHEDSTPSLSINPNRNVWQCFGCGAAGTSIDWTMREKGAQFREAVELLLWEFFPSAARELLGEPNGARPLTRRSRGPELPCPFDLEADDQTTLNEYADFCHALFSENAEPQDYVKKRGLDSAELVSRFKLGYQDRTLGLRLPTNATKAGREVRDRFEKLGLLRQSGHGSFVGSLVVPTIDPSGNVTGIYARKTRDDLNRHASPKHLYLRGPDCDVFNEEAFQTSKEIVLTEARIDALSFWRWGFRNVTACRGAKNFSQPLFDAFVSHGIERCFIAFDHDEAGDEGATAAAQKLMKAGVACFRVHFPRGIDANEVALKMTPADKTLALFLRSAEWMGNGNGNGHRSVAAAHVVHAAHVDYAHTAHTAHTAHAALEPTAPATVIRAEEPPPSAAEAAVAAAPSVPEKSVEASASEAAASPSEATESELVGATEEEVSVKPAPGAVSASPVSPVSPGIPTIPTPQNTPGLVRLTDDEAELLFEDRCYRVRGLRKCLAYGSLRVNLKAEREGILFEAPSPIAGWHMDNLDLCAHRARQLFERVASHELGVKEDLIRFDLGRVVRVLETVQEKRIAEASVPKVKLVKLSEKETEEAIAFWKSPDLFTRIADDYTKCGLVGELTNKIATYVSSTSRLLDRPLAIIIQSSSAAGKSTLMEKTLGFMPEEMREKYTAVSGKSLFYLDEGTVLKHKILAIVEEEGAEKATYPLKILQSEGELVMASTGKDPHSGKLVTKIYKVEGPVMIILTTTSVEIDPELENRCLRLTVDESREQTRAIHELQRMRMTHEGHVLQAERQRIEKVHQNAQRLLRRLHVHNPYAKHLTFVSDQTRTRRDHDKYLALIETIALMHQFQRPVYRLEVNGTSEEYVDVTLEDIELAGKLVGEILGQFLSDLAPQTRSFLQVLDEMVTGLCATNGVERSELRFTRRQVRELTGWTDFQVRIHMARLIELEHVLVHRGTRGQSFVYELLYAGEGKDGMPFVLGLVDVERLRREEETATTTATSRGEKGHFEGSLSPHRAPIEGPLSPPPTAPEPAPRAASLDSEARSGENALIPPARKARSYTLKPVVPEAGDGNGNGNGNGHGNGDETVHGNGHRSSRLPRFNLLRFPPRPGTRRSVKALETPRDAETASGTA
jgi:hypothetical protein